MKCNFWRPSTGKSFSEVLILASYDKRLSYCGLVDARISASEKDLPVPQIKSQTMQQALVNLLLTQFYFKNMWTHN